MANRIDGGGSSSWWSWCCCCGEKSEPGETDKLTGTKQEKLLGGPPEQVRMGREPEPGATGSQKRSHSPGATYSKYQTGQGVPDSPMK